ncbi:uncharacterized protein BYT42DRAFT_503076 [Radiomyces spectabilis]|uniref:uncharacterized protein n=1 Tax=Radiomyces spectabilis TaxID=64574 RepID=UPI0022209767|nr:uncharacterized protein BYT42DRAFT_503076 [Radiomyces spectabilis]KAI8369279.1 hypothetical protein BYT42DRAFT_503076 [Radiomyces spectabilis]
MDSAAEEHPDRENVPETQTDDTETAGETEPAVFVERKRSQFSYNASALRQRTKSTDSKPTSSRSSSYTADAGTTGATSTGTNTGGGGGFYECNICFDTAIHPVLTLCGHLFCWSCLGQWLYAQARNPTCPVCKAGCGKDKVIPIYGRGQEEKDPREDPSIPTRPAGQRPPPVRDPNRPATSFFGQPLRGATYNAGNVSIAAGFGLFPFSIAFNFPMNGANQGTPQSAFMSRLVLMLIMLFVVAVIFA